MIQYILLTTVVFLLLTLFLVVFVIHRFFKELKESSYAVKTISEEISSLGSKLIDLSSDTSRISKDITLYTKGKIFHQSPINKLSFKESMNPALFMESTQKSIFDNIEHVLNSKISDIGTATINSLRVSNGQTEFIFTLSKDGKTLIDKGIANFARDKSGRLRPYIKDVKTGKFLKQLKGGGKLTTKLASLSAALVTSAHIVSGHDISKRLKNVEKNLNFLVSARKIDQLSRLEGIYTFSKEILSIPLDREAIRELWRLRRELAELRSAWRQELSYNLEHIQDPSQSSWIKKFFTMQKTTDNNICSAITEGEVEIGLIEYSIRMDMILAECSGTIGSFLSHTLPNELDSLEFVRELLMEKSGYISNKFPDLTTSSTNMALCNMVDAYKSLMGETFNTEITSGYSSYE